MAKTKAKAAPKAAPKKAPPASKAGKRNHAMPMRGARCQEASPQSTTTYIACGRPADFVIRQRSGETYNMCAMCADHNVSNRDAAYVFANENYTITKIEARNAPAPDAPRDADSDPAPSAAAAPVVPSNVPPLDGAETSLLDYVEKGMYKFAATLRERVPSLILQDRSVSELAHVFAAVRRMTAIIEESIKPLTDAETALKDTILPSAFEREKVKSFTTTNGYRVTISERFMASINGDKREEAYEWLKKHGLGELIVPTVNAGTLSSALKHRLEDEGKEAPEELFRAHYKPGASLTAVKQK